MVNNKVSEEQSRLYLAGRQEKLTAKNICVMVWGTWHNTKIWLMFCNSSHIETWHKVEPCYLCYAKTIHRFLYWHISSCVGVSQFLWFSLAGCHKEYMCISLRDPTFYIFLLDIDACQSHNGNVDMPQTAQTLCYTTQINEENSSKWSWLKRLWHAEGNENQLLLSRMMQSIL